MMCRFATPVGKIPLLEKSTLNWRASTWPASTPADAAAAVESVGLVAFPLSAPGFEPMGRKAVIAAAFVKVSFLVPPINIKPPGYTVENFAVSKAPGLLPLGG